MLQLDQRKQQHGQLYMPSVAATALAVLLERDFGRHFELQMVSLSQHWPLLAQPQSSVTAHLQQLRSLSARSMTRKTKLNKLRCWLFEKKQAELVNTPAAQRQAVLRSIHQTLCGTTRYLRFHLRKITAGKHMEMGEHPSCLLIFPRHKECYTWLYVAAAKHNVALRCSYRQGGFNCTELFQLHIRRTAT